MNRGERQAIINQDLREFVALSRRSNQMPIRKKNPTFKHDSWVFKLAWEDVNEGHNVIVTGRLTGERGFPDIARVGPEHRIVEVLASETLAEAEVKVLKYPPWQALFFSTEKESFL